MHSVLQLRRLKELSRLLYTLQLRGQLVNVHRGVIGIRRSGFALDPDLQVRVWAPARGLACSLGIAAPFESLAIAERLLGGYLGVSGAR
jgi:hypothetical protein